MFSKRLSIIILLLFISCSGCATLINNDSSRNFIRNRHEGMGVAVGKLKTKLPVNSNIVVRHVDTGKIYNIVNESTSGMLDAKGYLNMFYCIELPEGVYLFESLETNNANFKSSSIELNSRFKVTAGEVKYQGGIIVESQNMMSFGGSGSMRLRVDWVNEYDATRQELNEKCPWLAGEELRSRFQ